MITLITGTPGAGKTAYAVMMLQQFVADEQARAEACARQSLEFTPRQVFVVGVPDLAIPHELAPPPDDWVRLSTDPHTGATVERWAFPDGSLVIVDECQTVYRPRSASAKVPPHVAALERHRHQGLDFWLITQSPSLVDRNVRVLVGKHIHLRSTWAGRRLLEWPEATDPTSRSERTAAVSRSYRLPKSVFSAYKSASVHIKQSRRLPLRLYGIGACFVAMIGLGWYLWQSIAPRVIPEQVAAGEFPEVVDGGAVRVANSVISGNLVVSDFVPRLVSFPESAPIYDADRKIHQLPHVAGCVATAHRCTCYTQQGTDAFLPHDSCLGWLASRPFNPFLELVPAERAPHVQPEPFSSPSVDAVRSRVVVLEDDAGSIASTEDMRGYRGGGGSSSGRGWRGDDGGGVGGGGGGGGGGGEFSSNLRRAR